MNKIRYNFDGSSNKARTKLKHLDRLGKIRMVKAVRIESWRTSGSGKYRVISEKLVIQGQIGKASFGACWGYGGSGPHLVLEILKMLGVPKKLAEKAAFESPRNDTPGTDWQIEFHPSLYFYKTFVESCEQFKE